jgi:uncharacterized membrane protein YidH (DUF202 family)
VGDAWEATADPAGPGRDPGLARERTDLAWNRSGLAALVVVAILLRHLWPLEGARSVLAFVLIAVGAGAWALGMHAARRNRKGATGDPVLGPEVCRMLTVGTVLLALAGLLLALFAT